MDGGGGRHWARAGGACMGSGDGTCLQAAVGGRWRAPAAASPRDSPHSPPPALTSPSPASPRPA
eukprot:6345466-Prymnesium_polylepis.1